MAAQATMTAPAAPQILPRPQGFDGALGIPHIAAAVVRALSPGDLVVAVQGPRIGFGYGARGRILRRHPGPVNPTTLARMQRFSYDEAFKVPQVSRGATPWINYLELDNQRGPREVVARKNHARIVRRVTRRNRNRPYAFLDLANAVGYRATRFAPFQFTHIVNFNPPRLGQLQHTLSRNHSAVVYLTPTWEPTEKARLRQWLESLVRLSCLVIGRLVINYSLANDILDLRAYYHGLRGNAMGAFTRISAIASQPELLPAWDLGFTKHHRSWSIRQVSLRNTHASTDARFVLHLLVAHQNDGNNRPFVVAAIPEQDVLMSSYGRLFTPRTIKRMLRRFLGGLVDGRLSPSQALLIGDVPGITPADGNQAHAQWTQFLAVRDITEPFASSLSNRIRSVEYAHHSIEGASTGG